MIDVQRIATVNPPAKLNLFLELVARRKDGYHDIDTVMVAIDWCDHLTVRRTRDPGVLLKCDWAPSRAEYAASLGISSSDPLLDIPTDDSNLVCKALNAFADHFDIEGGFACTLDKYVPAGAGMGGASSDAASALLAAARLCDVPENHQALVSIASAIGSDVPFFLGCSSDQPSNRSATAAKATGTGTDLEFLRNRFPFHAVVVFPGINLSTAKVYAQSSVPPIPLSSGAIVDAWTSLDFQELSKQLMNRLSDPARKLAPQIDEILESMWRNGAITCQLTGSGSACFALCQTKGDAEALESTIRSSENAWLENAIVRTVAAAQLPPRVSIQTIPEID
ncbi:4-diphosphocytidyl-2-C-methyl-D-erythritol kinase [Rubripirellula amarantea]|uniref:4-diphosphocytidyl-2-C-methyl-D-erythritol kinase n=1 Tax=Rubripirellula amarantea TaxID=2527999 RepID=A0A5C5WGL2_9BACT|nr:4-(cytidine 5'-diphospho)-2-C-methyl-D-erythritol kinase [Rubripirellula amarantea]TWT49249.1 4-diphosphocytidyl-2-C-methyl-D-erythritol kinase [Rubripirellula amarantea]